MPPLRWRTPRPGRSGSPDSGCARDRGGRRLAARVRLVLGGDQPALRAGTVDPGPGLASAKPALVNLSVTRCRLNGAAYPATILDLAADGYLTISERVPGRLWCDVPASSPPGTGLARSEQLVLAGAGALAGGRGAPFEALAESCASDVRGRWDPFERAVRAEGRRAGITRPRLSAAARLLLYVGAGVVGAAAFAAVYGRARSGLWAPTVTAFSAFVVLAFWARSVGRRDRLTAQGAALGAWAARAAGEMPAAGGMAAAGEMAAAGGTAGLAPPELGRAGWPGRLPSAPPSRSPVPPRGWRPGSVRAAGGPGPGRASPGSSRAPPGPPRPGRPLAGNGAWSGSARRHSCVCTRRSGWCWPPGSP